MNSEKFQPQIARKNADVPSAGTHLCPSATSAAKEENAPKVSVIVPVYKVEKYLPACIESVLAQTFPDFELILVDDGSPDNSGKICDDYAARDPRIRVFHKENGGVSSARNLGLDNARGEWIAFVDPDDWIDSDMYERMYHAGTESDADFVWCDFWTESDVIIAQHRQNVEPADSANMLRAFLSGRLHGSVWCKLIRSSFLRKNKVCFPTEIGYCEDLLVSIQLAKTAEKITHVPCPFYHYRIRENAATSNLRTRKALADFTFVLEKTRELLRDEPSLASVLNEAFLRHKARMLRVPACPMDEIRKLPSGVPAENSLTFQEKALILGFEKFGRIGAAAVSLFFQIAEFAKTKIRELIFLILRKNYARSGLGVKILIADFESRMNASEKWGGVFFTRPIAENALPFPQRAAETAKEAA